MKPPLIPDRLPDGPLLPGAVYTWLKVALKDLTPDAAERVRAEYRAYYADATSAGETDLPQRWGDPRKVNMELRRAHLTAAEAKLLPPTYERGWSGFVQSFREDSTVLVGILIGVPYRLSKGDTWPEALTYVLVMCGVILLALTGRWLLLSRLRTEPIAGAVLHWALDFYSITLVAIIAFLTVLLLAGVVNLPKLASTVMQFSALALLGGGYLLYHLSRLVRSVNAARKVA